MDAQKQPEARSCVTVAVDFFAYHSDRSASHPIAQVKHPVTLNNYVWVFQQVQCVDGAEVALAGPEHDGCDVHAHLVDQTRSKRLATDVAGGDLDDAVTREVLCLGHGCFDAVDEMERCLGAPVPRHRPVRRRRPRGQSRSAASRPSRP